MIRKFYSRIKEFFSPQGLDSLKSQGLSLESKSLESDIKREFDKAHSVFGTNQLYILPYIPLVVGESDDNLEFRCLSKQMPINELPIHDLIEFLRVKMHIISEEYHAGVVPVVFFRFGLNKKIDTNVDLRVYKSKFIAKHDKYYLPNNYSFYQNIEHGPVEFRRVTYKKSNLEVTPGFLETFIPRYGSVKRVNPGIVIELFDKALCSFQDVIYDTHWMRFILDPQKGRTTGYYVYTLTNDLVTCEIECRHIKFIDELSNSHFLKDLETSSKKDKPIIVWDCETYVDKITKKLIPYACGWRLGEDTMNKKSTLKTYWLADFDGRTDLEKAKNMVWNSIKDLLILSNNGYSVYCHNLSGFDGPILIDILKDIPHLNIKLYERKLGFDISYPTDKMDDAWKELCVASHGGTSKLNKYKKVKLSFKDSYRVLPLSLRKLAKAFDVSVQKSTFPHHLASYDMLDYCGVSPTDPNDKNWSFRGTSVKYLENDLNSLYLVLIAFLLVIQRKYMLNFYQYRSLPSLALAIYRAKFMPRVKIPVLSGLIANTIRSAYFGGRIEVFKPVVKDGYLYDVNSLYPSCMLNDMPAGIPTYVYKPCLDTFFGFAEADVVAPNIRKPFLPRRIEGRTVFTLGSFRGWYFSEELKYAKSLGYQINLQQGYKFERGKHIFTKYINHFYAMKKQASSTYEYYVAKLMMNSLYGRFGLKNEQTRSTFVDKEEFNKIVEEHEIDKFHEYDENNYYVEYKKVPAPKLTGWSAEFFKKVLVNEQEKQGIKSSISIAAAITSYGRITMYKFIVRPDCHYTDTDSIVLSTKLDDEHVNNNLGGFKLEYAIADGIFVSPKAYAIKTADDQSVVKFKGISKGRASRGDLYRLYSGETIRFNLQRMYRNYLTGIHSRCTEITINPSNDPLKYKVRDTKGRWIDTYPMGWHEDPPTDTSSSGGAADSAVSASGPQGPPAQDKEWSYDAEEQDYIQSIIADSGDDESDLHDYPGHPMGGPDASTNTQPARKHGSRKYPPGNARRHDLEYIEHLIHPDYGDYGIDDSGDIDYSDQHGLPGHPMGGPDASSNEETARKRGSRHNKKSKYDKNETENKNTDDDGEYDMEYIEHLIHPDNSEYD